MFIFIYICYIMILCVHTSMHLMDNFKYKIRTWLLTRQDYKKPMKKCQADLAVRCFIFRTVSPSYLPLPSKLHENLYNISLSYFPSSAHYKGMEKLNEALKMLSAWKMLSWSALWPPLKPIHYLTQRECINEME